MPDPLILNVARDFSKYPAGRYKTDGPFAGEALREILRLKLATAVLDSVKLVVELDGGMGYSSGFLEEAFGGLVRCECYPASYLHSFIELVSKDDESLVNEIWTYVDEAQDRLKAPIRVAHSSLKKLSSESPFKVRCPECPKGVLLVSRNQQTMGLAREDYCILCGQRFVYTDKDIEGMALEPERTQPS